MSSASERLERVVAGVLLASRDEWSHNKVGLLLASAFCLAVILLVVFG